MERLLTRSAGQRWVMGLVSLFYGYLFGGAAWALLWMPMPHADVWLTMVLVGERKGVRNQEPFFFFVDSTAAASILILAVRPRRRTTLVDLVRATPINGS